MNKLDLSNVCAICLDITKLLYYPITNYLDEVFFATNLELNLFNDSITKICSDCLKSLQNAIEFKELCCKTQKTISEFMKDENSQNDVDSYFYNNTEIEFVDLSIKNDENIKQQTEIIVPQTSSKNEEENDLEFLELEQQTPQTPVLKPRIRNMRNRLSNLQVVKNKLKKNKTKKIYQNKWDLQCDLCGKIFNQKYLYRYHIDRVHKGIVQKCEICVKEFVSAPQLRRHMAIHLNERKYKCTIENCDRAFNDTTSLRIHIKSHSNEKEFVCEICCRPFKHSSSLRFHLLSHLDFKKLECEICGRGFNEPYRMREHVRIHTGEKPIECQYCDKIFRTKKQLRSHVIKDHQYESSLNTAVEGINKNLY